jgi:hypothetical protein
MITPELEGDLGAEAEQAAVGQPGGLDGLAGAPSYRSTRTRNSSTVSSQSRRT